MSPRDLILLGGAPGVGKSTVAKAIACEADVGSVVEVDTLWGFHARADYADGRQFTAALRMLAALVPVLPEPAVLVAPWSLQAVRAFESFVPARAVRLVSLVCADEELRQRLARRAPWEFRDISEALALNAEHGIAYAPVATCSRAVHEVLGDVMHRIRGGA